MKKKKNAVLYSQYKEYKKLFDILQEKSKSLRGSTIEEEDDAHLKMMTDGIKEGTKEGTKVAIANLDLTTAKLERYKFD